MELLVHPIATAEFLVVDTETNGLAREDCELTEVGTVLVGGGELHDRWASLSRCQAPLRRGIQRFTGITQSMVDAAPPLEEIIPIVDRNLRNRVMVAHNAPFDRRVLRQAFERAGMAWPNPPVICTAALARSLLPLQRARGLSALAGALGVEFHAVHRALADAETCARVLCALLPKLCANAVTIADALALLRPKRPRRPTRRRVAAIAEPPKLEFAELPRDPGVYLFRDSGGRTLYVGKSVSIRSRARAHFAPSSSPADWTSQASVVDYRATNSELGALVLENRLIKALRPPGNIRLARRDERLIYIRCRLDIPFPILEVAADPAPGRAVTIGPLAGRRQALELVEQLDSLFGLRHCGRRLPRREHPSAYGQMGRCLSPCLGDLDPNLYRRRLDDALRLFTGDARGRLLEHVEAQMRRAAAEQRYERAIWLRRRARRLRALLGRLDGVLEALHARPRLIIAAHPVQPKYDAFWLAGGRLVDCGPLPPQGELVARTDAALAGGGRADDLGAHLPPEEIDEVRIVETYLASHSDVAQLPLAPPPSREQLERFAREYGQVNGSSTTSALTGSEPTWTSVPGGASRRTRARAIGPNRGDWMALPI
ncbi:MAG: 3'-5' exoribonuclease [Solirubrobacterales bacterium]|nr:3'-5' exoribonuclease [Solirubrobacterales bacterium]MBV9716054.1 3'-5' exoribonuclease [Solirubrobacterales bacterium]